MRIGFLFNHYAAHQLLHAAPIAFELSRRDDGHQVEIFVLSDALKSVVERIARLYPGETTRIHVLRVPLSAQILDPVVKPFAFLQKSAALKANAALFRTVDILVVPEKTSLKLKQNPTLQHLKFVYTHHGAGDRAEAYYPELAHFDLVLTPGRKIANRLLASGLVAPERCAIVGYPKFSVAESLDAAPVVFPQKRTTVLYNPHYSRTESSWQTMGRAILDFFKASDRYNLIFAPHVLLYQRWLRHRARTLSRWRNIAHIHLDTGSDKGIDMTHSLAADIYLGDVSSQVYEFLYRPRPVIFLDSRNIEDWRNNESFMMWRAGDVLHSVDALPKALSQATIRHPDYLPEQKALFADTFDLDSTPSEKRAADAIIHHFTHISPVTSTT